MISEIQFSKPNYSYELSNCVKMWAGSFWKHSEQTNSKTGILDPPQAEKMDQGHCFFKDDATKPSHKHRCPLTKHLQDRATKKDPPQAEKMDQGHWFFKDDATKPNHKHRCPLTKHLQDRATKKDPPQAEKMDQGHCFFKDDVTKPNHKHRCPLTEHFQDRATKRDSSQAEKMRQQWGFSKEEIDKFKQSYRFRLMKYYMAKRDESKLRTGDSNITTDSSQAGNVQQWGGLSKEEIDKFKQSYRFRVMKYFMENRDKNRFGTEDSNIADDITKTQRHRCPLSHSRRSTDNDTKTSKPKEESPSSIVNVANGVTGWFFIKK